MKPEIEAKFLNINKDELREKLTNAGAELLHPERILRRTSFLLPGAKDAGNSYARVRDEGHKITMACKTYLGSNSIENQLESELVIDDYKQGEQFLEALGCIRKSTQETKREEWRLDGVDIMIDEWPFLAPFVEIEGVSKNAVMTTSEKLGFDYSDAVFYAVSTQYANSYSVTTDQVNLDTPRIAFNMENPFI